MLDRIAVIGAGGQLGRDVVATLGDRAVPIDHAALDITDPAAVNATLDASRPTAVINVAAYNRVDDAETDVVTAFAVNAWGPRGIARWCAERDVPLLHVSTDYVFGGDTTRHSPLTELDAPAPVSAYGLSKLAGEHFVRMTAPRHFIVRTCGLYGQHATRAKGNFVRTILRLAGERDRLEIVDDQHCMPTATADLAPVLVDLLATEQYGVWHATNSGDCTWYEFAREIARIKKLAVEIVPTTSDKFVRPARRPGYSVLDCSRLTALRGNSLPTWQDALARFLRESAE